MEINAEYLREIADVKASILEAVDFILNSCEISAKEGRYSKLFKHLDNSILDMDEMEEVMNILNKKGLKSEVWIGILLVLNILLKCLGRKIN